MASRWCMAGFTYDKEGNMERINHLFREIESKLCWLATSDDLSPAERERMTPTFARLLEAENEWKLFLLGGKNGKV